ncbi:monocarboxylate transporter 9-like [Xyrauchen texanus]|uniref:monocarboxylate transporter 9-like n=1 Tax=Xyrauchen texanus TaxID=154827 RepID=UPI002241D051|nr:monocarboxylate transporter 9-like [Xyrauchen texanus]XP_051969118.1 monocarboxylate transporter 9-like [Xyrauchen texanus]
MSSRNTKKAPDGGWGWAIVFASFMGQLLAYGSPQSVGVLYPEWLNTFQDGKGMTAWVGSLVSGVGLIASPICSACVVNFGARPVTIFSGVMVSGGLMLSAFAPNVQFLIFSYGIVVGLGCGLVYAATVTIICQYFDVRRGLALGIVTTGTSIGGFLYATVQNELIALFGLDGCLLLIGCFALNIIACAGLMRPLHLPAYYLKQRAALAEKAEEKVLEKAPVVEDPTKKNQPFTNVLITGEIKKSPAYERSLHAALVQLLKKKQNEYSEYLHSTCVLLQNRVFSAMCVSLFLYCLGAYTPLLFLEDLAQSEGLIDGISTIPLVSIMSIAAGVGKLLLGITMDICWINSIFLYALTLLGSGVGLLVIPITKNYAGLQVISAVLGFFSGNWSVIPYMTTKVVGMDRLTEAYGILMFFGGFSIMLGPPVAGWIYDWMHSYDLAFYFSGSFALLGGAGLFLSALSCCNKNEDETNTLNEEYTDECDAVATVA